MKERFINSSLDFIMKYQECDDLKVKKLKYGLEGIYNLIIKLIFVILISFLLNTLTETLLLILFYAGIRTFSFGWHAKTSLGCWITTILIYNLIPLLVSRLTIPNYIGYIILGIAFLSMIIWAPADTPKRPLIRKKQRMKAKILSLIVIIIYGIIYAFTTYQVIKNSLVYALIIQTIFINPITYRITNTRFNNYKYYKKEV